MMRRMVQEWDMGTGLRERPNRAGMTGQGDGSERGTSDLGERSAGGRYRKKITVGRVFVEVRGGLRGGRREWWEGKKPDANPVWILQYPKRSE